MGQKRRKTYLTAAQSKQLFAAMVEMFQSLDRLVEQRRRVNALTKKLLAQKGKRREPTS